MCDDEYDECPDEYPIQVTVGFTVEEAAAIHEAVGEGGLFTFGQPYGFGWIGKLTAYMVADEYQIWARNPEAQVDAAD